MQFDLCRALIKFEDVQCLFMYKKLVIQNSTYISNNYWAFVLRPFLKNKSPILTFRQGLYLTGLSFSVRMFYHRCIPKEIMRGHNKVVMNWAVLVSRSEVKKNEIVILITTFISFVVIVTL